MEPTQRWEIAQKSESRYWLEDAEKKFLQDERKMLYYKERAHVMNKWIENIKDNKKPFKRILEIGCGPLGVCGFIDAEERYAIDPLEHLYKTRRAFTRFRDNGVVYTDGKAENLPFEDKYFDFVIIDNALDHAISPDNVLSEVCRVLRDDGFFYASLHVYTTFAGTIRQVVEATLRIDKGHPYIFKRGEIKDCFEKNRLKIIKEECENPQDVKTKLLREPYWRRRAYAFFNLAGLEYKAVCRKDSTEL